MKKTEWFELRYRIRHAWRNSWMGRSIWWVKYRVLPWHQYHLIKTGLEPGYYDADVRMEVGLVQMLIDYVEIEFFQYSLATKAVATRITPLEQLHAHLGWLKKEAAENKQEWEKSCNEREIAAYEELIELYVWCSKNIKKVRYEEEYSDYEVANYSWVAEQDRKFQEELERRMFQIVKFRKNLWT